MKKLNYEKIFYSISILMVLIWAFSLISLLFGFDTPQYSRDKTISENEEYLYQWTNKLKNGTAFNNLCFSDGTCMTSAGVGSISVYTNPNYLTGSGILASPLSVNSDNVTIQGNTFNSANKLLQLDGAGLIPSYLIPSLNYLSKSGDTMSGNINMNNNHILNVSSITTGYIYSNKFYGDGANIQYISPNNLSSGDLPVNVNATAIKSGNYFNNVKVSSCIYSDKTGQAYGDNLGNHIATMTITANYGINASTIQTKNILVYEPSAQPYINILSMNYLNSPEIRFSTDTTNSSWAIGNVNTWGDALVFKQKGLNEKMILTQDGKLSIGTNPFPTEKLEVYGNIKANSFINTTQGTTNYIVVSTAIYALNGGGGGGSGGYTSFVIDDFSSYANGSQTQFTLSQQPLPNSLQVSKNGLVLKSTDDYTLSGQVITMVTAPSSNTALMAQYAVGISTTEKQLLVSTNTWSATNTFNNNTIFNSSITINANTSQKYALTIDSNSNSSDGYIVSISTIGEINYINQIGRFIYKQNFDNVTSVTILNLSFNKNYKLLYNLRPNTTSGRFYLRFNNVTSQYYYALLTIAHSESTKGIGSGSATSIPLDYTNNTIGMYMHGDLSFSCYKRSSDNNYITSMYGGSVQFRNDSYLSRNTYSGLLNTTTNPLSSVTIFTNATSMTGDIYLYEEVVK